MSETELAGIARDSTALKRASMPSRPKPPLLQELTAGIGALERNSPSLALGPSRITTGWMESASTIMRTQARVAYWVAI